MFTSSRRATWMPMGPFWGRALEISGRTVSTPNGVSNTSQQGGGSIPSGHFFCSVPMIHPRRCKTIESGELKSLLETIPVRSRNNCGALNAPEAEIKSPASRRVRKSRGEHPGPRHNTIKPNRTAGRNVFVVLVERMNVDYRLSFVVYRCERILTNCSCLRGRKGEAAIWPSNFFDQRPGTGA